MEDLASRVFVASCEKGDLAGVRFFSLSWILFVPIVTSLSLRVSQFYFWRQLCLIDLNNLRAVGERGNSGWNSSQLHRQVNNILWLKCDSKLICKHSSCQSCIIIPNSIYLFSELFKMILGLWLLVILSFQGREHRSDEGNCNAAPTGLSKSFSFSQEHMSKLGTLQSESGV